MKNFIKYFLVIAFVLSLSACEKKDSRVVIQFSSWGSKSEIEILTPILQEFEQKNPDIKIEFLHIPKNYFQKLQLLFASNLAPDVIFLNNFNAPLYYQNDLLLDLRPFIEKDTQLTENDFFPQALQAFEYQNSIYAIPRDVSNLVIFYNKDIFDKYNVSYPSTNWDFNDFLTIAQKLTIDENNDKKTDIYGVGFEEYPLFWLPFLWSNNGGLINTENNTVLINKLNSIEALQFYADLRNKYHVAPTRAEAGSARMAQLFMQGKLAMQISGRWSVPRYRKDIDFDWDIISFPNGKEGSIVDADSSGWAISKSCKNQKQAWQLVSFLASKNIIEKFTHSGLIVPSRVDVANSQIFLENTQKPFNSKIFISIIPSSMPTPANKNYQEILDITKNMLEPLWNGEKPAKDVITDKNVEKIQKLMN